MMTVVEVVIVSSWDIRHWLMLILDRVGSRDCC